MGLSQTFSNFRVHRWILAICFTLIFLPFTAQSSVDTAEELGLPEARHLAASLSDPDSRIDSLMTLIAIARLLDYGRYARVHEVNEYAERFRREREWLDQLAGRYTTVPMRGAAVIRTSSLPSGSNIP